MQGSIPAKTRHVCRKCGEQFPNHLMVVKHWKTAHGWDTPTYCNANCSFKMTYHEVHMGRVLYGEAARQKP